MKHTNWMKTTLTLTALIALVGCHSTNTTLMSPIYDPQELSGGGKEPQIEQKFTPKTKVLFVIDDSASMEGHQTNLRNNINLMVDELAKDSIVDFKFAVTTIFDSVRYGTKVPKVCAAKNNEVLWEDNGTLIRPKAPKGSESLLASQPANYIKRGEGFTEVLKETLKVGVKVYEPKDPCPSRGPEFEEYFTTIKQVFELAKNGGPNADFYNDTDAHLMIVILADTGDSSTLSAGDVYNYLKVLRNDPNGKTFTIHAVTDPGNSCSRAIGAEVDKSGPIEKTLQLVQLTNGTVVSMCDPQYGKKLAALGTELRKKVTENLVIPLTNGIPEEGTLKVILGKTKDGKDNVLEPGKAWAHNVATQTITLRDVPWSQYPGESIKVKYIPVDLTKRTAKRMN